MQTPDKHKIMPSLARGTSSLTSCPCPSRLPIYCDGNYARFAINIRIFY
jgi:hypothetical protein